MTVDRYARSTSPCAVNVRSSQAVAGAVGSNIADQLVQAGAEEIVVLDNFVRGRRENLAWAVDERPRADCRGRHPRPRARR